LGALIGWAISSRATLRSAAVAILLLVLAATFWAATAGRPLVNLSKEGERDLSSLGYAALERGDNSAAIRYLKQAAKYRYVSANTWYNLGVALSRSGDLAAAYTAFARAAQLEPGSTQYKTAASEMKEFLEGGGVTPHEP
jgi:Flp pilus assembly protein TadD